MKVSYQPSNERKKIADNLLQKRSSGKYTVIDVGGHSSAWTADFSDCFVDLMAERPQDFKINLNDERQWGPLIQYVEQNGKFDYAICSHTIEDLAYPQLTLRMLPQIAKAGVILAPSLWTELSPGESQAWQGYFHHRWYVTYDGEKLVIAPKVPFTNHYFGGLAFNPMVYEICMEWEGTFEFSTFLNDYLGPTYYEVFEKYWEYFTNNIGDISQHIKR